MPIVESLIAYSCPILKNDEINFNKFKEMVKDAKFDLDNQNKIYNAEFDRFSSYKIKILTRQRKLLQQLDNEIRRYNKDILKIYDKLSSKNFNKWITYDLLEFLNIEMDIHHPTKLTILTILKLLYNYNLEFDMSDNLIGMKNFTFNIRPKSEVNIIKIVNNYFINHMDIVDNFIKKSKSLMEFKNNLKFDNDQLVIKPPTELQFSQEEENILNFIKDSTKKLNTPLNDPYESICCVLLKNFTKFHNVTLENWKSLGFEFLQDVGVYTNWETIQIANSQSKLVRSNDGLDDKIKVIDQKSLNDFNDLTNSQHSVTLSNKIYGQSLVNDGLDNYRIDFNQLPVYVIDDFNSKELDDGLSIEKVDDCGNRWIHIHIADPTSLIPFNHQISLFAKNRNTTLYLPDKTIPMLPPQLCMNVFSLGANKDNGIGQKALTFSAKLNSNAHIIDYKIQPSIINNIKILQYDKVDQSLKFDNELKVDDQHYPLLDKSEDKNNLDKIIDNNIIEDLENCFNLSKVISSNKVNNGAIYWESYTPEINIKNLPLPTPLNNELQYWNYKPIIKLNKMKSMIESKSRFLVSQFMSIAGIITGKYFKDKNLPGPFRGSILPQNEDPKLVEELLNKRNPLTGKVTSIDVAKSLSSFSSGSISTLPIPHLLAGIVEGYGRVTSPLRRYTDMIFHYQIKSSILKEKDPKSVSKFMFPTHQSLEPFLNKSKQSDTLDSRLMDNIDAYWIIRELKNRSEINSNLFKNLTVIVTNVWKIDSTKTLQHTDCEVVELGHFKARLSRSKFIDNLNHEPHPIGTIVKASVFDFTLIDKPSLKLMVDE